MTIGKIAGRCTVLLLAGLSGLCLAQGAAMKLTEQTAVERSLARQALQSRNAGTLDAADSDVLQARTLPNPVFGYAREPLDGSIADERQITYSLSQRFELGGKRGLRIDAATARLDAARSDVRSLEKSIANEARKRFHEALALQMSAAALTAWERRLVDAEDVSRRLEKGGEVAGYDRRRVGRERATAASRSRAALADLSRSVDALRALIGAAPQTALDLEGPLLPAALAPLPAYLANLDSRPDLKALEARALAFQYEERLAEQGRIPDVTVSAGVKQVDRGNLNDSGFVLGLSIPVPIFERGEAGRRRAAGQSKAVQAEREIALAKAQGDVRGLWSQASQLRLAAEEFRREAVEGSRRLAQIAGTAYRGGELGILELLDAHRGLAEAETRALELELAARAALLELELVTTGVQK